MKSATLSLILLVLTAISLAVVQGKTEPPGIENRVAIIYWATPEEVEAYEYVCEFSKTQLGMTNVIPGTTTFSTNNFFQHQLVSVFGGWINTKRAIEHDKTVREISATLQSLNESELRSIKNIVDALRRTNAPPPVPQPQ